MTSLLFFFSSGFLFLSNHFVNNADMDNQVHRLGVNFHMLPINSPKCPFRDNHFEGKMNVRPESRGAQEVNYFPSRMDTTTKESPCHPVDLEAVEGHPVRKDPPVHKTLDDFHQAGNRWRSFDDARKRRFSDRLALSLSGSRTTQEIRDIWLGYWSKVDETLGNMIRVYDRSLLWLAFFFFSLTLFPQKQDLGDTLEGSCDPERIPTATPCPSPQVQDSLHRHRSRHCLNFVPHKRINKIKKNKEKNWYPLIATLWNNLLLLPELGNLPAQNGPAPLLEDHELEAVKVGVGVPLLALLKVLGPGGSLELANGVVGNEGLLKSLRLGGVGHAKLEVGQREALEVDGLAGNSGGGAIDQSPVVVNDINNNG